MVSKNATTPALKRGIRVTEKARAMMLKGSRNQAACHPAAAAATRAARR
jgi:hypothetical protein